MSKIEQAVIEKITQRAELGKQKYGVTMERTDLNLLEWLQHLQDELMDAAVYTQKLIELNQNLSSSISEKPSWDAAPEWANWLAQEGSGRWVWYEKEPIPSKYVPYLESQGLRYCAFSQKNWKETLEQRPQ